MENKTVQQGSIKKNWFAECYRGDPVLTLTGIIHIGLSLIFIGLLLIDSRTLLGVNVWVKPLKFALSISIYVLTLAFILKYVKSIGVKKLVSYGTAVAMFVEMAIITTQATRGKQSHFNYDTILDMLLYMVMGVMIVFAMTCSIILLIHLYRIKMDLPKHLAKAIRLGLLISILGGLIGGYMSSAVNQHTVGAPDGGAGLPFLNWSVEAGDLRIAHFFGLHALQAIPLLTFLVTRKSRNSSLKDKIPGVVAVIYTSIVLLLFVLALLGIPLIRY